MDKTMTGNKRTDDIIEDDDLIFNPNEDFLAQGQGQKALPKFVDPEEKVKFDKFYEKAKAKEELKHEYAIKTLEEKQRIIRQTIKEAKDNQVDSIVFSDDFKLAKEFQDELDKEYSVDQITNNFISYRTFLDDSYLEKCLANMYDKINEGREVKVVKDSANNKYIPYDNRDQIYYNPIQLKLLWENVPAQQKTKRIKDCRNALELMFDYITNGSLTPRFCLFWLVMFGLEEFNVKIYKPSYKAVKKVKHDKDGNVSSEFFEIDPNEILEWTGKRNTKRQHGLAQLLNDLLYKVYDFELNRTTTDHSETDDYVSIAAKEIKNSNVFEYQNKMFGAFDKGPFFQTHDVKIRDPEKEPVEIKNEMLDTSCYYLIVQKKAINIKKGKPKK